MSTRAQIKITDSFGDEIWFYRHSDGYPEGTMPTLERFLAMVQDGKIRDNASQASGWLVLIGHWEYLESAREMAARGLGDYGTTPEPSGGMYGWKVGAYEPCAPGVNWDSEYLYTIDLAARSITIDDDPTPKGES